MLHYPILALGVSIFSLSKEYFIIFQNLFYFPIIIACVYYTKRGLVFSAVLAVIYFFLTLAFTRDSSILLQAFIRVIIFILVAGVITYLSLMHKKTLAEKEALVKELHGALDKINTLSGLIPICSWCKKIRNDQGYWQTVEHYIAEHSQAEFTHGMCPDCAKKYFPEKE
jgi:ABC-type sugar transport system permease subunit